MDRLGVKVCTVAALGCAAVAAHGCGDAAKPAAPSAGAAARPRRGRRQRADRRARRARLGLRHRRRSRARADRRPQRLGRALAQARDRPRRPARADRGARSLRRPRAARGASADPRAGRAADRARRAPAATSCCARSAAATTRRPRRWPASRSAMTSFPVSASPELPLPSAGIALDSPLVPEVSGGPVVDQAGRLVGMAEAMGAPGAAAPAVTVPWARIRERLDQLRPGPRRVFVGWARAVPLRRPPARVRARDAPRLPRGRRAAQRADRAHAAPRHGRDGRLMSVLTETRSVRDAAAALGDRRSPAWSCSSLLLAPAAAVLLTRQPDVLADGQRLPAGRLPTDVAVQDSTVWVVSGRDNRVVALDAARRRARARDALGRRFAAAAGDRRGLGLDRQRGRRHRHALRSARARQRPPHPRSARTPSTSPSAPRARG